MTHILTLPNGDIIREGEYGVTRDGRKVGPIAVRWPDDRDGDIWGVDKDNCRIDGQGKIWVNYPDYHFKTHDKSMARDIVAKWVAEPALPYGHVKLSDGSIWDMTAERQYPFGMLTGEQQAAMKAHGGAYQLHVGNMWVKCKNPLFFLSGICRVTPKPKHATVTHPNLFMSGDGMIWHHKHEDAFGKAARPVTVTYDTIDGIIDYETYKVDAR